MWFVTNALVQRLLELYTDDDFEISYPDAMPLPELYKVIDNH